MRDPHSNPRARDEADATPGRPSPPGTPSWVKVFGIIALAIVLLFVILHLSGNSPFGPGGHTPPPGRQQP